jgi:hypothetical protein
MKDALVAIVEVLQLVAIRVTAIELALLQSGKLEEKQLETYRAVADPMVWKEFSSLHSMIHALPDERP